MMWPLSLFNHLNEESPVGTRKNVVVNNGFPHVRQASVGVHEALTSGWKRQGLASFPTEGLWRVLPHVFHRQLTEKAAFFASPEGRVSRVSEFAPGAGYQYRDPG